MTITCFLEHPLIQHEGSTCPLCAEIEKSSKERALLEEKIGRLELELQQAQTERSKL
jgi:hypothetical protein